MPETEQLADGTRLAIEWTGDPRAEVTVLLVHSYAQDRRIWHKVLDILPAAVEKPVRVLAYDHRGHGDSSPADEATATMEQLGDDLRELIDRRVPHGRIVLVGHGMGGLVVMACTARHPDLVHSTKIAALAFLATAVGWQAEASAGLPRSVGRVINDLQAILGSKLVEHVRAQLDKATTIGLRWLLLGEDPDPDDVRLVAEMVARHWPETVALFRPALDRYDREAALSVVADVPVLAVVGDRDRLVPASHARALADAVHHGDAVVLPGLGHMLPLEGAAQIIPRIVGQVHAAQRSG